MEESRKAAASPAMSREDACALSKENSGSAKASERSEGVEEPTQLQWLGESSTDNAPQTDTW